MGDEKFHRKLRKALKRQGFTMEPGSKHWRILDAKGNLVTTVAVSAGDYRASKNLRAQLRQCGIEVPTP